MLDPNPGIELPGLMNRPVSTGFRRALDQAWPDSAPGTPTVSSPDLDRGSSLMYQILDEMPVAALVTGYADELAGVHAPLSSFQPDICAGWATGGSIVAQGKAIGHIAPRRGPSAPTVESLGDPEAWHPMGSVGPYAMRRSRRIDLWPTDGGGPLAFEAFFRDSYFGPEGLESVLHEYLVAGELEADTHVFLSCQAEANVLPWAECPGALASAGRLIGTTAHDLRHRVRQTLVGTTTCTHLNDTLRALAVLPHMAATVEQLGRLD
jgi:hypothetical protein